MTRSSSVLLVVGIAGSAALAACGGAGAGAEAKAPAKADEPASTAREREPTSVEEAQELIARANADLSASEAGKKLEVDKDSAAAPPAPGGGSTGSTTTAKPTTPGVREESSRSAPADLCSQSCRALSSMRRAVSALCRMTGDEDARCSDAKKTLEKSESRVARCHCSP
jgi:hypothetical protein